MKMRSIISLMLCLCLTTAVLVGCGGNASKPTENVTEAATTAEAKTDDIDYMVLVNKTHKLPDDWEEKLETVHMTNSVGDDVETEKKAYDAYLKLKAIQEQNPDSKYTQIVEFLMDFHTPENTGDTTFEPDRDYTDYQWWLARTADSGWGIVSFGYGA